MKNKISSILVILAVIIPSISMAQIDPGFDPNKLINDTVFSDTQTFGGAAGIQKFLESQGSALASTSSDFIAKLKEPDATMLKQSLEDPEPKLDRLRTAAELIWDASIQSGLNPQVILVTLNKEQGLINASQKLNGNSLQTALDHAMGVNCGDDVGCWNIYPGFYYQLFGNFDSSNNRYLGAAKSLMKSFSTTNGRGPVYNGAVSHVGDTIVLQNTVGSYDGVQPQQTLTIANRATAALYRFTPHVFNGNYNFWKYFNSWFKYPNGTLLGLAGDAKIYIIQNGSTLVVPDFVAQARGLNLASKITISPTEFASYPSTGVYGPADNTVAKTSDGKTYVFINNIEHAASEFVITQRGLNAANALQISDSDISLFQKGNMLTPKDGTILRGQKDATVYLVNNGTLQQFTAFTLGQRKIPAKQIVLVPDAEVSTYEKKSFVPPLDGSLIKTAASPLIYLTDKGTKRQVLPDIFKNRKYKARNITVLPVDELAALPIGAYAEPKDNTYFAVDKKTGPLYMFKQGTKHIISAFVGKQKHLTPDYVFTTAVVVEWFDGIPLPPKDGTILKGDKNAQVYVVINGQLQSLTMDDLFKRKIKPKQITALPQAEVDSYGKVTIAQ